MKKPIILMTLISSLVFTGTTLAATTTQGGFVADSRVVTEKNQVQSTKRPDIINVQKALLLTDDSPVRLKGNIIQSLGGNKYQFKDDTGTITVEIDSKRWQGQHISPKDDIEIMGEIDREGNRVEVDVKRIVKIADALRMQRVKSSINTTN